jgi:hypothetical protein
MSHSQTQSQRKLRRHLAGRQPNSIFLLVRTSKKPLDFIIGERLVWVTDGASATTYH